MILFGVIRHGPTDWNEAGIVQGRSDIPLSEAGRALVQSWRAPVDVHDFTLVSSPLRRAAETASILFGAAPRTDGRLAEMDWALWEGMRLPDLRAELGDLLKAWEAKGLDFRAPGGESPRDVQNRLMPLLAECAAERQSTIAVCHKGVIRALYALASGWDMTGKPKDKLRDDCVHLFQLRDDGTPAPHRLNIPLTVNTES